MRRFLQRFIVIWTAETWLLVSAFLIAVLVLMFGLIANQVMAGSSTHFDRSIILALRGGANNLSEPTGLAWVPGAARDVTALGSVMVLGILVVTVAGYLLLSGARATALLVLVAVAGGEAINSLLKILFARPRPDLFAPAVEVFTASFPSGHAALSAITYMTLALVLARGTKSRQLRIYIMAVAITLIILIGVSRVYLGVHYPTDILAGWCFGSAWALSFWVLMFRLERKAHA
jgi:undecaprenyl-diphosphatase